MIFDYEPTGSESAPEEEPLWTCIACLGKAPRSVVNERDGLCEACGDEPWPRVLEQLPT
jgi:hypothetical protein